MVFSLVLSQQVKNEGSLLHQLINTPIILKFEQNKRVDLST